ncbi:MAG: thiol-disulfide oxidoreductase DCC family protein [Bacteroidia bacterium]
MTPVPTDKSIVLFDGVCNFCNNSINFIIRNDVKDRFRFAPLQSELGKKIQQQFHLDDEQLSSVILIENNKIYTKTTAALRIAKKLKGLWPLMYAFIIIPYPVRDIAYNIIAKYRYKWWGQKDACMIPTPEIRNKFIG